MFALQNINASVYKGVMFVQMITKFTSFINNRVPLFYYSSCVQALPKLQIQNKIKISDRIMSTWEYHLILSSRGYNPSSGHFLVAIQTVCRS